MAMLEVKNLGISFGGLRAVNGFHITIEKNQLYGLIGPNGAGKTTVFNLLTGVYKPDTGSILLDGKDITGESDIAQIMVKAGLGIAGLLIIVFSTVTTTFLDAYSAGISSESIFAGLKGKYVAVVVTVIGTIGAIVYPMDDITDFLYLIGSVFAPMIAVQIADFFILKKKKSETGFDWCNLLIWLTGFILYRVLMNIDMLLGNTLPDMVLTILLCMIVAAVRGRKKA